MRGRKTCTKSFLAVHQHTENSFFWADQRKPTSMISLAEIEILVKDNPENKQQQKGNRNEYHWKNQSNSG